MMEYAAPWLAIEHHERAQSNDETIDRHILDMNEDSAQAICLLSGKYNLGLNCVAY